MSTMLSMVVCLVTGLSVALGGAVPDRDLAVFELREVAGFDVGYGHHCQCEDQADPNVTYPAFSSAKPLYSFARIDMEFGNYSSGVLYQLAMDESGGTGTGYDRLYIDLDRDGDLAEETPLTPMIDPPDAAQRKADWIAQQVCFGFVDLSGEGSGSVQVLPRLTVSKEGYVRLALIPTQARRGEIEIAGRRFDVVLGNAYPVGTRWDRPATLLTLTSQTGPQLSGYWSFRDRLMAMHKIGGTYWLLSATPAGDQLLVEPYRGDFGTFALGSARRFAWSKGLGGTLLAQDRAVLVGKESANGEFEPAQTCELPVGDYAPEDLSVYYGPLYVSMSGNPHADGKPLGRGPRAYPLQIRKDAPCILDFSDRAEILFAWPPKGMRIKPGDELTVNVVLVDPKLDVAIAGLRRLPLEQLPSYVKATLGAIVVIPLLAWLLVGRGGRRHRFLPMLSLVGLVLLAGGMGALHLVNGMLHPRGEGLRGYHELDPEVAVYRANGEMVPGSAMPADHRYSWRVPGDLQLGGDEEIFTIKVVYETYELYGTVTGTREFTISKNE
ncbi:MAG: hypothetical protein ABFD90_03985 [Phycisphaerales bacterium]